MNHAGRTLSPRSRPLIVAVLVAPCILITIPAFIAYRTERQLAESREWVIHTLEVERRLERLASLLVDVESGQRGFLLSGRDSDLAPYHAALNELPREIATVRTLTADNPVQQQNLRELDPLIAASLDSAAHGVSLQQHGERVAALEQMMNVGHGKETMETIRTLLRTMEAEEQRLLITRQERLSSRARRSTWILSSLVAINVLFAGAFFVLYRRMIQLQDLVTVCAWSRTVEYEGEWLSFEKYLLRRFGLNTSHGIAPEAAEKVFGPRDAESAQD